MILTKFRPFRFLLSMVSVAAATALHAEDQIKVTSGQKVAFLGDSITQFGWERPGGYVKLVAAGLDSAGVKIIPVPAGISGNTSRDMLARVDKDVISRKPDWMTLSCGVNDVWHGPSGVDLDGYEKNITAIVDKAQAAGIKVMILTATVIMENDNPNNQKLAAYNDFLRQLAKERNLPLVDLNAAFQAALKATPPAPGTLLLTVDGVHMNPEGNMLMARGILQGFGMSKDQIDKYEAEWRKSDDAAGAFGTVTLLGATGASLQDFAKLNAVAQQRKVTLALVENELFFAALRTVMKAHENDASFTPMQAAPEMPEAFRQQIKNLPTPAPAK